MTNADRDDELQPTVGSEPTDIEMDDATSEVDSGEHVSWQAYEHLPDQRPIGWYIGFGVVTLVFMALAVLIIRSWTFALVIAAAAVALVVYIKGVPRTINYTLSPKGLYVDDQLKPIGDYKAFGVRREGDMFMLTMLPTKRFVPSLTAFFPESAGEQIVDILASRLPMQEIKPDVVDELVRRLRL